MGDLKKKIIDILFEDDTPIIDEAPLTDVKPLKKEVKDTSDIKKEEVKDTSIRIPNAKEVLYGKKSKQSSFIDYLDTDDSRSTNNKELIKEEKYELRENVSPIFGPINQKERKRKSASEKEIQKAVVNNPPSEYVSVVISPIYGYDSDKANDARKVLEDKSDRKDNKMHEDMSLIFDDNAPFDMPIDDSEVKEIAREAVFESVVELHKNKDAFEDETSDDLIDLNKEKEDLSEEELPVEDMYTSEITKDEIREAFDAVTRNEFDNYESTSLFDLDDYVKDDAEDDLFDELNGDRE